MITVDIKSLLKRLNPFNTRCLESAAGLCVSRNNYEVSVEHVFAKLIEDTNSDLCHIIEHFEKDVSRVRTSVMRTIDQFKTGNAGKPVFSPLLMEWYQDAWLIASVDLGENRIRSGTLLLALLKRPTRFATGEYTEYLEEISYDALISGFHDIVGSSAEQPSFDEKKSDEAVDIQADGTALKQFCVDFTARAREGEIDPVFGRDAEIRQMIDILARRRKNNPIAVGEAGVGKTAVVEGLALRVVEGDVPDLLKDVAIVGLDMGLLQAGASVKGEFENRLKSVISEIKASPKPIILFIDEAHVLIGAGGQAGGSDAANLLKPALARGELRTVAATTWSEYKKYFEKDAALARRFQLVKLDEPSVETATLILRGLKEKYEQAHSVVVRDDAIVAAAEMSSRYISGRQLPDKAVDLLDTSAARVKILLSAKPDVIEDRQRRVQALEREKVALDRDRINGLAIDEERMTDIESQLDELASQLEVLDKRWQTEKELSQKIIGLRNRLQGLNTQDEALLQSVDDGNRKDTESEDIEPVVSKSAVPESENTEQEEIPVDEDSLKQEIADLTAQLEEIQEDEPLVRLEVDPDVVAKVVADWTGIPLGKVMRDEAKSVMSLEDNLSRRIKGQDTAIHAITQNIEAAKTGLKDPDQPMGIFLLVGPSGVGKTETGLAVADTLFGGERFMVSINMSEFQEKHTVSRLIGSPPGYVGYGEGGVLTEAVRQRPYSVVLLDEVEKADLEVMNIFYQVFDKGVLSDGEGRVIDFKNTVLFLTSNLASDVITEMTAGEENPPLDVMVSAIRPVLSNHFKAALLARMTIVPFFTLDTSIMKDIVALKMDKLANRIMQTHRMKLDCSDGVLQQIADRCTEVETGARNIDHIMNGTILPQMSREILARMSEEEMPSKIRLDIEEGGTFSIEFE